MSTFCSSSNDNRRTDGQHEEIKEQFYGGMRDIMNIWKSPTFQEKTIDSSPKVGDVLELSRKETFVLECSAFLFLKISLPKMYLICVFFYKKGVSYLYAHHHLLFLQGCYKCLFCLKISAKCVCTPEEKVIFHPRVTFLKVLNRTKYLPPFCLLRSIQTPFS